MNKIYRIVFNRALSILIVVSELARGATKASSGSTPKTNNARQLPRTINHFLHIVPLFALLAASPVAAVQYWDTNGATNGSGNAGGVWDTTSNNWTSDPNGTSATTTWNNANGETYFSAGTDGTGALAIDIQPTGISLSNGLIVKEGNLTFTGGNFAINNSVWRVNAGASATFNNVLTGGGITKTGGGTLSLTNSNNALSTIDARAIWQREGDLNIDGGTYRATGSQISHALLIRPDAGVTTNTVLNNVTLESFASANGTGGGGLFAEIGNGGGVAINVTVNGGSISSSGLPAVSLSGAGTLTLKNVTVSSSGSSAHGVAGTSDSAIGVQVTIDGGTITTTNNGATSIGNTQGAVGIRSTGRTTRVDATDVVVSSNGYAAQARSDGAIINFVRGSLTSTAQDATAGSLAGAVVSLVGNVTLTDTAVTATGTNIAGVVSRTVNNAPSTVTLTGTNVRTSGAGGHGLQANANGSSITLLGNNNTISTTGAQAFGGRIEGAGATINFNGGSIHTTGEGSDAISVANGATKTFDGTANNILPTMTVAGAGAAVLSADAGTINLNNTNLNTGMTAGSDTWGIAASNAGVVNMGAGSSTGGTGIRVNDTGKVTVAGNADSTGSRIQLNGTSTFDATAATGNVNIGSIEGASGTTVNLGSQNLVIGANNVTNNGSLIDNANFAGTFANSAASNLTKTGSLNQILSGTGNTVGNVDIQQGQLTFAQPGDFTVAGNLNTASGATLGIGARDATLKIGGALTQAAGSRLDAIVGVSPDIKADSASLNGDLTISGFSLGAAPAKASDVEVDRYTLIATTGGITGNFTNVNSADGGFIASDGLDYLNSYGFVTNAGKNYELGFDLAWTSANDATRTGSFTMDANTGFDVDIALQDQAASALTGWDGKTLTKNGEGLLQLSAVNGYTGDTLLNGGVLKLDGAGDIASSNALTISGGQFDISSAAGNRTVKNLSGTGGEIILAGKTLTVNNAQDGAFAGDFDASAGSLVKEGAGELVLSGNTAFTGDTLLNAGQLTLDGSNGKAQLVSNVIGQTGTRLDLINGAVLTGTIDSTDVTIDQVSVWNMTGTSDVSTITLAGNINFADPSAMLQSGRTLTANNWVGQGGTVNMYAALGGNDSVADKLIIDGGQATGRTNLNIRNAGGLGDQTTGNGINVVKTQNSATTAVDAFALANAEGKVLAGAYEYRLARAGEDWFLQSALNQVDPVEPVHPVYSPVTSLHTAKAEQALQYAESTVGTLHERMGDLEALNAKTDNLAWGRVIGKHVSNDGTSDGIYSNDIDSRGDISALQIGNDFYVNAEGNGRTSAGVFLTFGHGKYDVTHAYNANDHIDAGDNSFDAYSLGGYVTHLNGEGGYLDTVVQVTTFDQTVAPRELASKSSNALGVLASVEVGQRFDVGALEQGLHVEPQAQVIVQTLKQDDSKVVSNVGTESDVSYDRSTTLTSRVGARLSKTWLTKDQGAASIWITPSVINTIGDDSQTRFATPSQGDVTLNNQLSGTRASLQLGIDGQVAKGISVSARFGIENRIDGDNSSVSAYGGQLGLKILF